MTRDNLLFGIIGILLGFIGGFLLAGNITQRKAAMRANPQSAQSGQLPANHPRTGSDQATTGEGAERMLASVKTAMNQASENPNDSEAQLTPSHLEYQRGRH